MENPRGSVSEPPEGWAWGASEGGTQHYDVDTRLAGDDVKEDIRLHPAAALLYSFPEGDVRVGHKKRKTHTLGPSLPVPPRSFQAFLKSYRWAHSGDLR
jgi:hypothetical protein